MNLKELKEVFRLVEKTDFTEVEIVQGDIRVRIERGTPTKGATPLILSQVDTSSVSAFSHSVSPAPKHSAPAERAEPVVEEGFFVTSPFVGTFYRTPSPDAESYVELGQMVKKGQPLCIVEAMKLMNEIESDFDGRIADIYVENAKPVEYGEKLFRIVPA